MTPRIRTRAHIDAGVAYLGDACPHMRQTIAALEGPIPLRTRKGGFEALLHMIVSQQVSVASATAIWARVEAGVDPLTPETLLAKRETSLQNLGLSRPKVRYARELASALVEQRLDLNRLARLESDEAIAHLTHVPGIGQWTAEIYLMFCLGRPDIFPSGDVALQNTYQLVAGLETRPSTKEMALIAEKWSPWRAVAARVLWTYLRQTRLAKSASHSETYP